MEIKEDVNLLNQVQEKLSDTAEDLLPSMKLWSRPVVNMINKKFVEVYVYGIHLNVGFYIRFFLDGRWVAQTSERKKLDEGRWKETKEEAT